MTVKSRVGSRVTARAALSTICLFASYNAFSLSAHAECPVTSEETGAHLVSISCGWGSAQLGETVTITVEVDNPAQTPLDLGFHHGGCMRLVSPESASVELGEEAWITQELIFEAVEVTPSCSLSVMVSGIPLTATVAIEPDPAHPDVLGIANPALAETAVQANTLSARTMSTIAAACTLAPYLVKDIYLGLTPYGWPNSSNPTSGGGSNPPIIGGDGFAVFAAIDLNHGREPWISDGTELGTSLLADIGPTALNSGEPTGFVNAGDKWYFIATHPSYGTELWATDGTPGGTHMVKDIAPGSASSTPLYLVANGNRIYFTAYRTFAEGRELWVSDGTATGTQLVKDIALPGDNPHWGPNGLAVAGGKVYFLRNHPDYAAFGQGLWVSDGTAAGTDFVKDINPGPSGAGVDELTELGSKLYFTAFSPEGIGGEDVWVSDGTEAGTHILKDIDRQNLAVSDLAAIGGKLYFAAFGSDGVEPWISDGTEAGTHQIKDIYPGGFGSFPRRWAGTSDLVFFAATTPTTGEELWATDGTETGTYMVKDLYPGP